MFGEVEFKRYNELIDLRCLEMPMRWKELLGGDGVCHLLFDFGHIHVFARCHSYKSAEHIFVIEEEFRSVQGNIQRQSTGMLAIFCFSFSFFVYLFNFLIFFGL